MSAIFIIHFIYLFNVCVCLLVCSFVINVLWGSSIYHISYWWYRCNECCLDNHSNIHIHSMCSIFLRNQLALNKCHCLPKSQKNFLFTNYLPTVNLDNSIRLSSKMNLRVLFTFSLAFNLTSFPTFMFLQNVCKSTLNENHRKIWVVTSLKWIRWINIIIKHIPYLFRYFNKLALSRRCS